MEYDYLILIITLILIILNIILSILITNKIQLSNIIHKLKNLTKFLHNKGNTLNIERIKLVEETDTYKIKLGIIEKLEIFYIERSNIRQYIPFINVNIVITTMITIFLYSLYKIYSIFHTPITSIVFSLILTTIPLLLLDLFGKYNSEKIRRMMADFLTVLRSWIEIKEDFLFALEKSISSLSEPLKSYCVDLVTQIKKGISPEVAIDIMAYKVNNPYFYNFSLNIKQALKSRGNMVLLLTKLEEESYLLEEEYSRRKMNSFLDRLLIQVIMLIVIGIVYYILFVNIEFRNLFIKNSTGRVLLDISAVIFATGFFYSIHLSKFEY